VATIALGPTEREDANTKALTARWQLSLPRGGEMGPRQHRRVGVTADPVSRRQRGPVKSAIVLPKSEGRLCLRRAERCKDWVQGVAVIFRHHAALVRLVIVSIG